ncbi:serine/threonine protein kinase [Robertmurraya mangrovi]|nr:serine/threonine-protein kinase [Bacillus sp. 31A1R]
MNGGIHCATCGWKRNREKNNATTLPMGTVVLQRYLIGRVLGQGGFGITYAAMDLHENRRVALKEYYPIDIASRSHNLDVVPISEEYVSVFEYGIQRFLEEAQALSRFSRHPGIVAVYNFFYSHQTAYMSMQFLEGSTWMKKIEDSGGRMSVTEAMNILLPALDALQAVHEVGMLHRDISPDNIIILPNKQVKLIDFGAARYAMKQQNQEFSIVFKPGYTPEEQYRSRGNRGPWSDLYSIAATFYRAITGKIPLDAMNRLGNDTLLPPSKNGVRISSGMEQAIMKALAVKGENRYQSVLEFKHALLQGNSAPVEIVPENKTLVWIGLLGAVFVLFVLMFLFLLLL